MTAVGIQTPGPTLEYHQAGVVVRRGVRRRARVSLLCWDLLAAFAVAVMVSLASPLVSMPAVAVLLGCWAACLTLARASEAPIVGSRAACLARVLRAGGALALAGSALSLVPGASLATGQAFAAAITCVALSCAIRAVLQVRQSDGGRVLVVGGPAERQHAVAALERRAGPALEVNSICVQLDSGVGSPGEISVPFQEVPAHAQRIGAHSVVVIPGPGLDPVRLRRLLWLMEDARLPCFVGTGLLGVAAARLATSDVGGLPLVRVHAANRSGPAWVLVEWADRCIAAVALALLLPLLLLLGVVIRRDSPGPAIYRQARVGRDGRIFTIFKLRTMTDERLVETRLENDCDGVLFKMRRDPRITPLGSRLRKYSLDELPQLANVVLGQMRLVGPRPALPAEVAAYDEDARRRLAVRPGITGLWQVSGRSDLTWEETVRLDLHYVDNWSPWLDLLILGRTVGAVLGHRGAY